MTREQGNSQANLHTSHVVATLHEDRARRTAASSWEFPEIRGTLYGPKTIRSVMYRDPKMRTQFVETPNLHVVSNASPRDLRLVQLETDDVQPPCDASQTVLQGQVLGSFQKNGVHFGVLVIIRDPVILGLLGAPDFWKLPLEAIVPVLRAWTTTSRANSRRRGRRSLTFMIS